MSRLWLRTKGEATTDAPEITPRTSEFDLHRDGVVLRGTTVGSGPPVVLLHAGRERRSVWRPLIGTLAGFGLRCISIDQRGHGESTGAADDLDDLGRDVRALVAALDEPVALVGCSLGGLAALSAIGDPATRDAVVGVAFIDVVPAAEPSPAWNFLERHGLLPEAATLFHQMVDRAGALTENLRALDGEVLLVRAERSALTDRDADRFAKRHGEVVTVPATGHLIARDDPDALARLLTDRVPQWFLERSVGVRSKAGRADKGGAQPRSPR